MIAILKISGQLTTPGLLKITEFWNKFYDVMISFYDVINNTLSHDSNYIVNVVMWAKFNNSHISKRKAMVSLSL